MSRQDSGRVRRPLFGPMERGPLLVLDLGRPPVSGRVDRVAVVQAIGLGHPTTPWGHTTLVKHNKTTICLLPA